MQDVLRQRLETLQSEYEAGQKMLTDLDARRTQVSQTLLRIEGAIQVLQELLSAEGAAPDNGRTDSGPRT